MTTARRKAHWQNALRELCAERRPLVERSFLSTLTRAEERLRWHLERELDWYEMALLRPGFDRLERLVYSRRKLARDVTRLVERVRKDLARSA